ncbi:MAG: helix-turn-helix transcriptional regulator [Salinigranum sp.]
MRSAALTFALLVVFAGFVSVAAATPAAAAGTSGGSRVSTLDQSALSVHPRIGPEPRTEIFIRIRDDADARWSVTVHYRLATDNETRAFDRLRSSFEEGTGNVGPDVALFERAAARASQATDREMTIENVTYSSGIDNGTGYLRLQFTWTNFAARTESDTLALGDVFRTPGNGTWLTSLAENQRLQIRTPPGYSIASNPGFLHRNDSIIVTGPHRFASDRRLTLKYERLPERNPGPNTGGVPWNLVVLGGGAAVATLTLATLFVRRRGVPEDAAGARAEAERRDDPGGAPPGEPTESDPPTSPTTAGQTAAASGAASAEANEGNGVDLSLLSDEERVEHLLRQNGGRMKQANIVRETGWSDAKVSQLLSAMAENERVEKLRLGRENLISLPDEDD